MTSPRARSPPTKSGVTSPSTAATHEVNTMHLDSAHLQPASPHSAFSPEVRTPETGPISPHHLPELFTFAKQPVKVKRGPTESGIGAALIGGQEISTDSEAGFSDGAGGSSEAGIKSAPPLSLLTALLQSPQNTRANSVRPYTGNHGGLTSALSSAPSTALSSPQAPHHGILQNHVVQAARPPRDDTPLSAGPGAAGHPQAGPALGPPASILRRGSTSASSDGAEMTSALGLALSQLQVDHAAKLETVEEKRERIAWADRTDNETSLSRAPSHKSTCLKFAVAPMTSNHVQSSSDADSSRRPSLAGKRDSGTESGRKRSASPFARERLVQSELDLEEDDDDEENAEAQDAAEVDDAEETSEEEEEVKLPGYTKAFGPAPFDPSADARDGDEGEASEESDLGYQEDEEDGMFSDEEDPVAFRLRAPSKSFPFARPTNYSRRRDRDRRGRIAPSPGGSPPPAPAALPPPPRRGRGHIRVMDPVSGGSGLDTKPKGCSRHCSPPPSRSRSGSNAYEYKAPPAASSPSARKLAKKLEKSAGLHGAAEAGPGPGRAGSPMPQRMLSEPSDDDDEEEEEDEDEEDEADEDGQSNDAEDAGRSPVEGPPVGAPGLEPAASNHPSEGRSSASRNVSGWRSDDSIFFGAHSQQARGVIPARLDAMPRKSSAPSTAVPHPSVFEEDDEPARTFDQRRASEELGQQSETSVGDGVRDFFRRASEHIPGFRRPSVAGSAVEPQAARGEMFAAEEQPRPKTAALGQSMTCPPALDDTPAIAASVKTNDGYVSDLAMRLEKTLGGQQAMLGDSLPRPVSGGDSRRLSVSHSASRPTSSCSSTNGTQAHAQAQGQPPLRRPSQSVQPGQGALGRAATVSGGRVAFGPPPSTAAANGPISRTTSVRVVGTTSGDEVFARTDKLGARHVSEGAAAALQVPNSRPIACPKKRRDEDTGWTEGQLLNIRKQAGKGDDHL